MSAGRELGRLAALLSVEPQRLVGVEALSPSHVAALRGQVSDVLHAEDSVRLGGIVGLIGHVPAGLAAGVVEHALGELTSHLEATVSHLEPLRADTGRLSPSIERLDEAITTLAGAVAPLQGASERVGRLVDRLPERRQG